MLHGGSAAPQPAHIHVGICGSNGPIKWPLNRHRRQVDHGRPGGDGRHHVDRPYINVHKSPKDWPTFRAATSARGQGRDVGHAVGSATRRPASHRPRRPRMKLALPAAALGAALVLGATAQAPAPPNAAPAPASAHKLPLQFKLAAQNGSGEAGTATLLDGVDGLIVRLRLEGASGDQPAHIHTGSCDKLNPKPAYPLKTLHDGFSEIEDPEADHDRLEPRRLRHQRPQVDHGDRDLCQLREPRQSQVARARRSTRAPFTRRRPRASACPTSTTCPTTCGRSARSRAPSWASSPTCSWRTPSGPSTSAPSWPTTTC